MFLGFQVFLSYPKHKGNCILSSFETQPVVVVCEDRVSGLNILGYLRNSWNRQSSTRVCLPAYVGSISFNSWIKLACSYLSILALNCFLLSCSQYIYVIFEQTVVTAFSHFFSLFFLDFIFFSLFFQTSSFSHFF